LLIGFANYNNNINLRIRHLIFYLPPYTKFHHNSPSFKNIPLVKQHKLVNTALAEVLHSKLHAITIKTKHY